MTVEPGPAYDDERGRLVPVDFAEAAFAPERAFVVSATQGAAHRGGHRADCHELMVLVSGSVSVTLDGEGAGAVRCSLRRPGDRLAIEPEQRVDYLLETDDAVVLVLADRPYAADARRREA